METHTDFHQFSFDRPPAKISELQFTPLEKRSFYSQVDTVQPKVQKKSHYSRDVSPMTSNNVSPDNRSLLLPPDFILGPPERHFSVGPLKTSLLIFTLIAFLFSVSELVVGWVANSICLMIDSLRIFYIFKAYLVPLVAIWGNEKASNKVFTFGYLRLEVLVSLVLIVFQWGLLIGLVVE